MKSKKYISVHGGQAIALTGGIGSGKSFVLSCFAKLGFAIYSADLMVHKLLTKTGQAFEPVAALMPEAVQETGINRNILGKRAFADATFLAALENIMHPLVRAETLHLIAATRQRKQSLICEIPLLFQTDTQSLYDGVILTLCPLAKQRQRALARKSMTPEKLSAILAKQADYQQYYNYCDWVVNTSGSELSTYRQVAGYANYGRFKRNCIGY